MLLWLATAMQPWNELYADNVFVSTGVLFAHLTGIFVAGGTAVTADRRMLHVLRRPDLQSSHLENTPSIHRTVLRGLTVAIAAGVLLFLADVETLAGSLVFRVKLGLVFLLLMNGLFMMKVERQLATASGGDLDRSPWQRLGLHARVSQALWFSTLLAGVALRSA